MNNPEVAAARLGAQGRVDVGADVGVDPLGSEIRALFTQLTHGGDLLERAVASTDRVAYGAGRERTFSGEAGRAALGARVRFQLRVRGLEVQEVRYRAYGCPYTLAACEWLARTLTRRTLEALSPAALSQAIGGAASWAERLGVPLDRLGRLLVIEDALRAALAEGEASAGTGAQRVRESDNL